MKKTLLLMAAILLIALPAAAAEVLVVQSVRSAIYEEALRAFRNACPADTSTLVLSDYADSQLSRVIHEERPRLVVALGDGALASLHKVRHVPVLAMMALGLSKQEQTPPNITGVDLFVSPEQYLCLFRKMKARRIGIVYDPARTGWYLRIAQAAAKQSGVELVLREVSDPRQALGQLATLKGTVDALWLLPDATAVNRETLEGYFLFAQAQSLPVLSFSSVHLKLGALLTLEADRAEVGRQAGEMALQLLRGAQPGEVPVSSPRRVIIKANDAVARRLKYPADLIGSLTRK